MILRTHNQSFVCFSVRDQIVNNSVPRTQKVRLGVQSEAEGAAQQKQKIVFFNRYILVVNCLFAVLSHKKGGLRPLTYIKSLVLDSHEMAIFNTLYVYLVGFAFQDKIQFKILYGQILLLLTEFPLIWKGFIWELHCEVRLLRCITIYKNNVINLSKYIKVIQAQRKILNVIIRRDSLYQLLCLKTTQGRNSDLVCHKYMEKYSY